MAKAVTTQSTAKSTKSASPRKSSGATAPEPVADGPRSALLRRSVLDAAAHLFAERGYGSTNLQDVAAALGMSRPNLYYYFSSKEKIFEALLEEVTYSIEQQSSQITDQVDLEPEVALRLVIKTHAAWLLKHGTLFRVIVQSESELPDHLLRRHNESKRHILSNVTDIIERGMRAGRFRPADAQVAAFSVIGMCSWTAWWFKADGRRTISDVADSISEMAAQALIRTDSHLNCGDDPLDAIKMLREDITYLEQLLKRNH